jgi:hypothetical protein
MAGYGAVRPFQPHDAHDGSELFADYMRAPVGRFRETPATELQNEKAPRVTAGLGPVRGSGGGGTTPGGTGPKTLNSTSGRFIPATSLIRQKNAKRSLDGHAIADGRAIQTHRGPLTSMRNVSAAPREAPTLHAESVQDLASLPALALKAPP